MGSYGSKSSDVVYFSFVSEDRSVIEVVGDVVFFSFVTEDRAVIELFGGNIAMHARLLAVWLLASGHSRKGLDALTIRMHVVCRGMNLESLTYTVATVRQTNGRADLCIRWNL